MVNFCSARRYFATMKFVVALLFLIGSALAASVVKSAGPVTRGKAKESDKCWPRENFLLAKAAGGCPSEGWAEGSVTWYMFRNSTVPENQLDANVDGSHLTMNFCGHSPDQQQAGCTADNSPKEFPAGAYCLYMYHLPSGIKITQNCPAGFKWSWVAIDDVDNYNQAHHNGSVPLGEFFSFSTVSYYCCRNDGDPNKEIVLPTNTDFVLLPTMAKKDCQKVKGMDMKKDHVFYSTENLDSDSNGAPADPDFPPPEYTVDVPKNFWGLGLRLSTCYYTPKVRSQVPGAGVKAKVKKATPTCWPKSNFGFLQTTVGCPGGKAWTTGAVQHWEKPGGHSMAPKYISATVNDQKFTLNYCMHDEKIQNDDRSCTGGNTAEWSPGSYCFFHNQMSDTAIFDKSCPTGFFYNWFVIDDVDANNQNNFTGDVPTGEYYDYATVYYACCRNDGNVDSPIVLPTDKPFVLLPTATDRKCQVVQGMKVTYGELFYDSEDVDSDVVPLMKEPFIPVDYTIDHPKGKWGAGMRQKLCYYENPKAPISISSSNPDDWKKIDGLAREVCIRGHSGPILRITDDDSIYSQSSIDPTSPDRVWTLADVQKDVVHCSIGFDGSLFYTDKKGAWHRQLSGNTTWNVAPADAVGIAQVSARSYYELAGVDTQGNLWHLIDGLWRSLPSKGAAVSFGIDGALYLLSYDKTLWHFDWTKRLWLQTDRTALTTLDVYSRNRIIYTATDDSTYVKVGGSTWTKIDKACKSSAITEFDIFCVDRNGIIWQKRFTLPCDAACEKSKLL